MSERGYALHVGASESTRAIVRVSSGHDVADVGRDLGQQFPGAVSAYSYPSRPGDIASLDGLRSFPGALAAVAILLGSAVLLNMLLATRHRRRRELATLSSLGLTSRGLRNCVVWQSVGVWIATTDGIGVATDVNRPLLAIGLWSSLALAVAVLLGTLAGARAARLDVAGSLRRE